MVIAAISGDSPTTSAKAGLKTDFPPGNLKTLSRKLRVYCRAACGPGGAIFDLFIRLAIS
jgi:hypothetical protein